MDQAPSPHVWGSGWTVKTGMAKMLKGGVIMDVTNPGGSVGALRDATPPPRPPYSPQ
eukprot:gene13543-57400_t